MAKTLDHATSHMRASTPSPPCRCSHVTSLTQRVRDNIGFLHGAVQLWMEWLIHGEYLYECHLRTSARLPLGLMDDKKNCDHVTDLLLKAPTDRDLQTKVPIHAYWLRPGVFAGGGQARVHPFAGSQPSQRSFPPIGNFIRTKITHSSTVLRYNGCSSCGHEGSGCS